MTVTRAFPIGALMKEKKIEEKMFINIAQTCDTCLQLRASTMQVNYLLTKTKQNFILLNKNMKNNSQIFLRYFWNNVIRGKGVTQEKLGRGAWLYPSRCS